MRTLGITGSILVASLALGCAKAEAPAPAAAEPPPAATAAAPKQATAAGIKPLEKKKFGNEITQAASTPLTSVTQDPTKFASQTIRTEGVVTAVCQSMGCWMEIGDETGTAHIKMAGHSFFIPAAASGHRAVIQGKVAAAPVANECSGKDGCREKAEKESGRVAKVEIEATGVEFLD
jgi:hypothetical protein